MLSAMALQALAQYDWSVGVQVGERSCVTGAHERYERLAPHGLVRRLEVLQDLLEGDAHDTRLARMEGKAIPSHVSGRGKLKCS